MVTLLEGAIKRDCLSPNFETTSELLGVSTAGPVGSTPVLPWIPATTAAVALRVLDFDASISYMTHQKFESNKHIEAGDFIVSLFPPFLPWEVGIFVDKYCMWQFTEDLFLMPEIV